MKKSLYIYIGFVGLASLLTIGVLMNSSVFKTDSSDAAGFGISPPYFSAIDMHPGETFSGNIRVLRSGTKSSQKVTARFDNLDIADWFEILPSESIVLEEGEKYARFNFRLQVPEDAQNGNYAGKIYFAIGSLGSEQGVSLRLGARADVSVNVIGGKEPDLDLTKDMSVASLSDDPLASRLEGRLVMRVESLGQLYYLHPENKKVYNIASNKDFLSLVREEGRGINNALLEKIPMDLDGLSGEDADTDGLPDLWEESIGTGIGNSDTDEDGFDDLEEILLGFSPLEKDKPLEYNFELAESVAGYLLLQVEDKGQIWYINPSNNKRTLLADKTEYLLELENKALGLSEENFQKIIQ